MDISIFPDKTVVPTDENLQKVLEDKHALWTDIHDYVLAKYPNATEEWNYPGKKYGWSFRMKDKKRAIIYFLPFENSFKVAFVFGNKALEQILVSDIATVIKTELQNARVYAEGRGIRLDVSNQKDLIDIKKLIEIKLAN